MRNKFPGWLAASLALVLVGAAADRAAAQDRGADGDRTRAWALRLIERYDKNGNKMLEKEEQATLRGKPAGADLNSDQVITLNELVTHLSSDTHPQPAQSPSQPQPTPSTQPQPQPRADSKPAAAAETTGTEPRENRRAENERSSDEVDHARGAENRLIKAQGERKSLRFKTPAERLPDGLPGWFTSRDANGDGQVAMSEYSGSWSDRTAAEFIGHDLDNDGFITPQECLKGN
jgi:hypothetical protein